MDEQEFSLEALIFVIILIIYVLTSHIIQNKKIPYVHQSTIAILMGVLTAAFSKYAMHKQIDFSNELFFTVILPPIIFSAGYSLRKSLFFQNFGIITFLGIIGTMMGFLCLTGFLILINSLVFQALTLTQLLTISSVLCATDTVAAMSLIKPQKFPVLNAVLFGEGILNDAVAIILYGTITSLNLDSRGQITASVIAQMLFDFCYLFFFSLAFGILTGFGLSYIFKIFESFNKFPIKQTSLILLNGYFTYLMGELLGLSGIITLFTCAIIMGHYSFMNLSAQSQKGTGLAFETVSYIAEAFVFAYLGASILSIKSSFMAVLFGLTVLAVIPIVRAIMVGSMPLVYKIFRREFPMNFKQLKICWYSGMVRGVIAFALCLQINSPNRQYIVTVALVIVLATTILGSTFLDSFAQYVGVAAESKQSLKQTLHGENMKEQLFSDRGPSSNYNNIAEQANMKQQKQQKYREESMLANEESSSKYFQKLQSKYIKPIFQKKKSNLDYQMGKQVELKSYQ